MDLDDTIDPDDFYAEADRRTRERRTRRGSRATPTHATRLPRAKGLDEAAHLAQTPAGRVLIGAVAAIAVFTVVGLVALWPGAVHRAGPSQSFGAPTQTTDVKSVRDVPCGGPAAQRCRQIAVSLDGRSQVLSLGSTRTAPSVAAGDTVRVSKIELQPGVRPVPGAQRYQFLAVDRNGPLWILIAGLALLALLVLRWRGLLAVAGVGLSLLLVVTFIVPAILNGSPGILVALVGALAVMFITVTLTNGIGAQALAATLGISATLLLTCVLASICVGFVNLDGQSGDVSLLLTSQHQHLSLEGIVLAGIVIGALGVLADTAVTQASAVMALRRADPSLRSRGLYTGAITVGRDHLSATIHTLVLAYAGASLPLLLAMRSSGVRFGDAINAQALAEPIVATVIGCVALIAAVPLTTGLAAVLVSRLPVDAVPDGHGHAH